MKIGIDVEKYLTNWAEKNYEEVFSTIEETLYDESCTHEDKIRLIYVRTLDFVFAAVSQTITENNKMIELQLRRAGINIP